MEHQIFISKFQVGLVLLLSDDNGSMHVDVNNEICFVFRRETLSELQQHLHDLTDDHTRKSQALSLESALRGRED